MRQVVHLKGKILQVRDIDRGESVGYGAAHRMARAGRIATVAVGYADGWLRSSSHRGSVGIAGQRAPVVGRISMDLMTLDVTGIDPAAARPGALVDLLDDHYGVDDAAAAAGTIGYEILTAIGRRALRALSRRAGLMQCLDFLASVGRVFLGFLAATGRLALFALTAVSHCVRPPFYPRLILRQMIDIGYYSLPVVGLTAIFTGMVLALQTHTGFSRFAAEGAVATVVVLSMTRELGPVIAALMVAGRIGAAIAAEIGTMRVTDQIDALTTLSTNPVQVSGRAAHPRRRGRPCRSLVLVADIIGVFGGFLVSTYKLGFNAAGYLGQTADNLRSEDVDLRPDQGRRCSASSSR